MQFLYDSSNNKAVLLGESKTCHALSLLKPKKSLSCSVSTTPETLRVIVMENYFHFDDLYKHVLHLSQRIIFMKFLLHLIFSGSGFDCCLYFH